MAETLVKVPGRQRSPTLVLPGRVDRWGVERVVVRLAGGGQTSCWVLRQPARLVRGWLVQRIRAGVDTAQCAGLVGAVVVAGLVLVENCTVDASIFKFVVIAQVYLCGRCLFVGRRQLIGSIGWLLGGQVAEGTRWMPWHQEPMKDVGGRDRPGGAVNQAVIPGCPNGETRHQSCGVTCT